MKTYEAIFEPLKNKGVYGISLVENPAMQGHFIALSETAIQLKTISEEERLLIGLVLEPNKPIYRNQDGEEFNIVFSEGTIKELSHGFYKGGFQSQSSLEHSDTIEGVTFVESWLIEDSKIDKSAALGLSYPKGSWMATMKVDSDDVWNDYVKSGKVKGFSVDALVSLKEVKLKSDIKMNEQTILEAIGKGFENFLAAFKLQKDEPKKIELASIKTSNGEVDIMFEGEEMFVEGRVWIVAEDGTEVPLPVGEYELEDKRILVVTEEGKIGEVKTAVVEEEMSSDPAGGTGVGQASGQASASAKAVENAVKSMLIKFEETLAVKHKAELAELKAELTKQNEKLVELSKTPSRKPVVTAPAQVPTNAKQRILETIQNANNN